MTVFRKSTMEMFSAEGQWIDPCEVRLSGGTLALSYEADTGPIVYQGAEVEPGHFKLTATGVVGRATLHRFDGEDVLEGWWMEEGSEGMWRVTLDG